MSYLIPNLGIFYVKDNNLTKNNKCKQCFLELAQGLYNIVEGL
jgi:hypothetical protein